MTLNKHIKNIPLQKASHPFFSSGPCIKPPFWNINFLKNSILGRSHRSNKGIEQIKKTIQLTKQIFNIPDNYHIALIPGGGTGAMESALWSLLGSKPIDVLSWDIFGRRWKEDIEQQLKPEKIFFHDAIFGKIPNLNQVNFNNDIVFTWNGTTTGVCIPGGKWIPNNRSGLTICDAVSAIGAFNLPWTKLDATAFSWQKGLGGEGEHGMLVLSPRSIERLNTDLPKWPIPFNLNLREKRKVNANLFKGETLNTPSLLCIEDWIQCLNWAKRIGGLSKLLKRVKKNYRLLNIWVKNQSWIDFLVKDKSIRSPVSVCLKLVNIKGWSTVYHIAKIMEENKTGFDIINHKFSSPCFRIWIGPTVESEDLVNMLTWFKWSYKRVVNK